MENFEQQHLATKPAKPVRMSFALNRAEATALAALLARAALAEVGRVDLSNPDALAGLAGLQKLRTALAARGA